MKESELNTFVEKAAALIGRVNSKPFLWFPAHSVRVISAHGHWAAGEWVVEIVLTTEFPREVAGLPFVEVVGAAELPLPDKIFHYATPDGRFKIEESDK